MLGWFIPCLLLCCVAFTASRNVEIDVFAPWKESLDRLSSVAMLAEFIADTDHSDATYWSFIDLVCSKSSALERIDDPQEIYSLAASLASKLVTPTAVPLMETSVGMGTYLPRLQFHYSLSSHYGDPCIGNAFIVVHPGNTAFCTLREATEFINSFAKTPISQNDDIVSIREIGLSSTDHTYSKGSSTSSSPNSFKLVLYGSIGSSSTCKLHNQIVFLYNSTLSSGVSLFSYIFRYGSVDSKGVSGKEGEGVKLQGYGVFLDIKNMEYKTIDDRSAENEDSVDSAPVVEITEKIEVDGTKVKRIRDLGIQIVALVSAASDKVSILEDLIYNFPSRAYEVSTTRVTRDLRNSVARWYSEGISNVIHSNALYLNGLRVDFSGSSFNIYDVISKITNEMAHIRSLSRLSISHDVKSAILSLAMTVNSPSALGSGIPELKRIDMSLDSKYALVFLNNLEKDSQYRSWPSSVEQLLMPAWSLHTIAKNLYTVILVIDPASKTGVQLALKARSMFLKKMPIRFGFALFCGDRKDVNKGGEAEMLSKTSSATRAHICTTFGYLKEYKGPSAAAAFLFAAMERSSERDADSLSLSAGELVDAYVAALTRKDSKTSTATLNKEAWSVVNNKIVDEFSEEEKAKLAVNDYRDYAKHASEYITARNVPLNSISINGIVVPKPYDIYSEVMQLLGREQYILGLAVQEQSITDKTKSIFNEVLKTGAVYSRYHSVLNEREIEYLDLSSSNAKEFFSRLHFTSTEATAESSETHEGVPLADSVVLVAPVSVRGIAAAIAALKWFSSVNDAGKPSLKRIAVLWTVDSPGTSESDIAELLHSLLVDTSVSSSTKVEMLSWISADSVFTCLLNEDSCDVVPLIDSHTWQSESSRSHTNSVLKDWRDAMHQCYSGGRCISPVQEELAASNALATSALSAISSLSSAPLDDVVVIVNARVFAVKETPLHDLDLKLFTDIESGRIMSKLQSILGVAKLTDEEVLSIASFCGRFSSGPARIDVEGVLQEGGFGPGESGDLVTRIEPSAGGGAGASDVSACFVVDPLSTAGQRAVAVMRLLKDHLLLPFTLVLTPSLEVSSFPLQNYYRFVLSPHDPDPRAVFTALPKQHVLTVRVDTAEPWITQAAAATQDIDNLKCDHISCGDTSNSQLTRVSYRLKNLLIAGQCFESDDGMRSSPPNGLQLVLNTNTSSGGVLQTDSMVMQNYGYFQLQANPGVYFLSLAKGRATKLYTLDGELNEAGKVMAINSFTSSIERIYVTKRAGMAGSTLKSLLDEEDNDSIDESKSTFWGTFSSLWSSSSNASSKTAVSTVESERIHVFSLATGHMYERLLRIMMLSSTKRTSLPIKFWLFENYLSPTFKTIAEAMSKEYGFEIGYVTYKWPEWLHEQTEKQRIIWGYKILFLDVLFPLNVKRIIYIDADQILRADLKELWHMDLEGKPYAYTPFCSSREDTLGFQFWRSGFWASHLQGKPYHISALYVVDLDMFRKYNVGDTLRSIYDNLARDPNSLANLDQDLPNYAQHSVPIHSLPQEWLWCESWCSEESKSSAKTIDLCNNPRHKEPKLDMARRIISGPLFNESWVQLDQEIRALEKRIGIAAE